MTIVLGILLLVVLFLATNDPGSGTPLPAPVPVRAHGRAAHRRS